MLKALLRSLRTGVVTVSYPASPAPVPERFRGAPTVRAGAAFDRLPKPASCPSGALAVRDGSPPRYTIDLARCIFCGRCAGAETGLELGHQIELASRRRESLVVQFERSPEGKAAVLPPAPAAEQVAQRIHQILGRSLALRHLDAGSCNGCDWELTTLLNPVYDVRRLGIDFVASPRHADGVIVTGPVTRNLEQAVRKTWEAVPEPRIVVAVGACASSGGLPGKSYASAGGVGEVLPVDVFIPGCPPRPEAIIFGILLALGRTSPPLAKPAAAATSALSSPPAPAASAPLPKVGRAGGAGEGLAGARTHLLHRRKAWDGRMG
ncbi:MAG TPA: NADH-quinone oxidoreductase subunit NuoB [Myxococcales bacterium]|jgi:Ni,Fe-hydrogenase III small subunit/formate hydrogenlyase subunit 6/NADH:ubiquinone oxidoreductase subunit I